MRIVILLTSLCESRLIATFVQGCGVVKDWSLFPEQTSKNGLPQKTCQECQGKTKAEWRSQIENGEREVGEGMAFHHPIVDGRKQCRQCKEWKPNDSDHFMTRAATDGLFHECRDCRRENARRYSHATWNAVLRKRYREDEQFRSARTHRRRLSDFISRATMHYNDEFGCTGREMKKWIEFQFDDDMAWDNYGVSKVWTIDHIIALDRFDLTNPTEQRLAFSWTNLQPCRDNSQKHTKLRMYEVMNVTVSARRFLKSRNACMSRYAIVGDTLDWLKPRVTVGIDPL